jgi:lysophospholipase L1-like esterase
MERRTFIHSTVLSPFLTIGWLPDGKKQVHSTESSVINAGIGGNNTLDLLERVEKDCLAQHPDLTVLMVGTNDMNSRKYIPIGEYEKNLQLLIRKIKSSRSDILLMNLLPVYEPYLFTRHNPDFYKPEGHRGRLSQMNARIQQVAEQDQIPFLDLHHVFETIGDVGLHKNSLIKNESNSNTTDGLHPTPDGYRIIGLAVYDSIVRNKLSTKKIVCFGDSITAGDGKDGGYNYPSYLKKLL